LNELGGGAVPSKWQLLQELSRSVEERLDGLNTLDDEV
jgi:hypothetical protein